MSLNSRISTLENKHNELDEVIRQAYLHHVNDNEISELKKKKLILKEEIETLKNTIDS
jgi:hypothetical protein